MDMIYDLEYFFNFAYGVNCACKCYCGQVILEEDFTKHLFSCKTYMKNSRFYQAYRHEYFNSQKPYESLQKIQENTKKLKKILDYQLEVIKPMKFEKELNDLIDLKTFPQSFFEHNIDDFKKMTKSHLRLLRCELDFLLENISQEFEILSLDLKRINSGDNATNLPQLNLIKSFSEIKYATQQKQKTNLKLMLLSKCDNCKKSNIDFPQIYRLHECQHSLCSLCLSDLQKNYIYQFGKVSCLVCKAQLTKIDLNNIIGVRELKKLDEFMNRKKTFPLMKCLNCKENFHNDPHDSAIFDPNRPSWVKCPYCNSDQCKICRCIPYHNNISCEEHINHTEIKPCRYCKQLFPLDFNKLQEPALRDICPFDECPEKSKLACLKFASCGHPCKGVRDETKCLGCMNEDCQKGKENPINENELCMICYTENLSEAPCIKTQCGHVYHYQCILNMISLKWNTKWISFTFYKCPLCKDWLKCHGSQKNLTEKIEEANSLYEEVKKKALERLKFEGKDKDSELMNQKSYFYNKPEEYAMKLYAYYECFKCKKPYFGGNHNCENEMQELENEEHTQDIKRENYLCFTCCNVGGATPRCIKHREAYIVWKCRYCCSIAKWHCFGTTHFCEACHNNYLEQQARAKEGKLVQCTDETCKLKIKHLPHGEEFVIGCGACNNLNSID